MEQDRWSRREVIAAGGVNLAALALAGQTESAYAAVVLKKKPVGYWRLGEKAGPTAVDSAGRRRDGAYHGGITFGEAGAIRNDPDSAIALNGIDDYVEAPNSQTFSQPASGKGLTVEAWMRPDALDFDGETGEHYVHWLGKGEKGRFEWGFRFYSRHSSRPNRISAYIWNPSGGLGAGAFAQHDLRAGEWIHVVACYDPGDQSDPSAGVSIYTNGVLRGSPQTQHGALYASFNITPAHGPAPVRFGTRDLGSFFHGALDEIAIYPRVLTADEVAENYHTARNP